MPTQSAGNEGSTGNDQDIGNDQTARDEQNIESAQSAKADGRHVIIDQLTARPQPFTGVIRETGRILCLAFLKLTGWKFAGDWPDLDKAVLLAAPHTSNWDGFNMLAAAAYYRVNLKWAGKKELTTGLFGGLVKAAGCVPIDRSSRNDTVAQLVDSFNEHDKMILAIAPEGSRSKTAGWKSGFYHIAHQAGVPIIMSVLDYGSKTIRISGYMWPTGNYEDDLVLIRTHYKGVKGNKNERYTAQ